MDRSVHCSKTLPHLSLMRAVVICLYYLCPLCEWRVGAVREGGAILTTTMATAAPSIHRGRDHVFHHAEQTAELHSSWR